MRSAAVKRWGGTFVALALGTICISLAQVGLPDGPGRTLTYAKCQGCYGLEYVIDSTGVSPEMWKQSVIEMENLGLELTPQERDTILNYLTTYLGPTPPNKAETSLQPPIQDLDGARLYNSYCSPCHQEDGQGLREVYPPLVGNPWLVRNPQYCIFVVLYGLEGEIKLNGEEYGGFMPPLSALRDREVAAIVNHVLTAWGNDELLAEDIKLVTGEDVVRARASLLSTQRVWEYREGLKQSIVDLGR